MIKTSVKYFFISIVSFSIAAVLVISLFGRTSPSTTDPAEARALFNAKCSGCHGLSIITDKNFTERSWEEIVDRMVQHGMDVTSGERRTLIIYLAENHGA